MPPQKQIRNQELCYKITQSFVTRILGSHLFLNLIATALKFLYLIATLSSLLIACACNLTVIRFCLMSVVPGCGHSSIIRNSVVAIKR